MESRSPNSSEGTTKNRFTTFLHQLEESVGIPRVFVIDDAPWHLGNREKCATESSVEIPLLILLSSNQWKLSAWKPGLNKHPTTIFEELCVKATYQSKVFDAINCYHTVWVACAMSHGKSVKLGSSNGPRFFPTCFNEEDILMWACFLCVSLRNTSRPAM